MVKPLLTNLVEVNNAIDFLSLKEQRSKKILPAEISGFKERVTVLEPFEEIIEAAEGQKKVTITPIYQSLRGLSIHLII